jgi:ribosomal protein L33
MVRCRACIKCREYIVIHPSNPVNLLEIKKFEKKHSRHTIVTMDLNEVKGIYESFKNNVED